MKITRTNADWLQHNFSSSQHGRAARAKAGGVLSGRVAVPIEGRRKRQTSLRYAVVLLCLAVTWARADQVEMQNGDRYLGTVLSLDTNTLVFRNSVLGKVNLPRGQVSLIVLGPGGATNISRSASANTRQPAASSVAVTNGINDLSGAFRQLGANTNFIEQVQAQFLADAGPEANEKFTTMVGGLLSGRLTVDDIRAEAKTAANQLKELKRDLGEDAGGALDGYLSILENFLRETSPPPGVTATNASRSTPKAKPESDGKKE